MALAMIEAAEADGRLQPGQIVVEYTGGKGYPLKIVSSDAFAAEKSKAMQAFGADVELIPSPDGITPDLIPSMIRRAAEIAKDTGGFQTDQFNNTDMINGYRKLGEELLDQLPGPPPTTAFCRYVGTAGCFLGTSRALSAALPGLRKAVVEPSRVRRPPRRPGRNPSHRGRRHRQPAAAPATQRLRRGHRRPGSRGFRHGRRAARTEGIFSGPSTGANLVAALETAAPTTGSHWW